MHKTYVILKKKEKERKKERMEMAPLLHSMNVKTSSLETDGALKKDQGDVKVIMVHYSGNNNHTLFHGNPVCGIIGTWYKDEILTRLWSYKVKKSLRSRGFSFFGS